MKIYNYILKSVRAIEGENVCPSTVVKLMSEIGQPKHQRKVNQISKTGCSLRESKRFNYYLK